MPLFDTIFLYKMYKRKKIRKKMVCKILIMGKLQVNKIKITSQSSDMDRLLVKKLILFKWIKKLHRPSQVDLYYWNNNILSIHNSIIQPTSSSSPNPFQINIGFSFNNKGWLIWFKFFICLSFVVYCLHLLIKDYKIWTANGVFYKCLPTTYPTFNQRLQKILIEVLWNVWFRQRINNHE